VLTLRVHDECRSTSLTGRPVLTHPPGNGSDVFGSDICTCKPYLVFAIEECIRTAQRGGVGVVVYFRKEGRALGEVTKYLVYNLRKRGGDSADKYFRATELIAGVKDMRFQALMPDVLHWLGIKKVDNMVSMSDMYVSCLRFCLSSFLYADMLAFHVGNTTPLSSQAFRSSSATTSLVRRSCHCFAIKLSNPADAPVHV
jgi:hypothetical protein